jgi:hypothetical protein
MNGVSKTVTFSFRGACILDVQLRCAYTVACVFNVIFEFSTMKITLKTQATVQRTSKLHIQNASVIDPSNWHFTCAQTSAVVWQVAESWHNFTTYFANFPLFHNLASWDLFVVLCLNHLSIKRQTNDQSGELFSASFEITDQMSEMTQIRGSQTLDTRHQIQVVLGRIRESWFEDSNLLANFAGERKIRIFYWGFESLLPGKTAPENGNF